MRLRLAVLGSVLAALLVTVVPGVVSAAPSHNRGLTINAAPNPVLAGQGVLIYGQLNVAPISGQTVILYHHVADSNRGYTRVGQTTTGSDGFYEFTRAEGVVTTNRSWFVKEAGVQGVHSRTINERVSAEVSLTPSSSTAYTGHTILFTGHVFPNHAFEQVLLQQEIGSTDDWRTIKVGQLGPGSDYTIPYAWRVPGEHDIRVLFPGDRRNIRSASDAVTVTIQQAQVPGFTINTTDPIIPEGGTVSIYGTLDKPGTNTPESATSVTLWAREIGQSRFHAIGPMVTGNDGSYSFTEMPTENTIYQVRTTLQPRRHSAVLFQGVRDVVTMTASSSSTTVGGTVTFMGNVTPSKAGRWVYLQRLGSDNDWHSVEAVRLGEASTFTFTPRFAKAGSYEFRARIYSDRLNVGAASPPVTVTVSGVAPVSTLPPAS